MRHYIESSHQLWPSNCHQQTQAAGKYLQHKALSRSVILWNANSTGRVSKHFLLGVSEDTKTILLIYLWGHNPGFALYIWFCSLCTYNWRLGHICQLFYRNSDLGVLQQVFYIWKLLKVIFKDGVLWYLHIFAYLTTFCYYSFCIFAACSGIQIITYFLITDFCIYQILWNIYQG